MTESKETIEVQERERESILHGAHYGNFQDTSLSYNTLGIPLANLDAQVSRAMQKQANGSIYSI